jgi:hypothetical protein
VPATVEKVHQLVVGTGPRCSGMYFHWQVDTSQMLPCRWQSVQLVHVPVGLSSSCSRSVAPYSSSRIIVFDVLSDIVMHTNSRLQ